MNGYLMLEQDWNPGEDLFMESFSPENRFGVVFEDDGDAAYFYAVEKDEDGAGWRILDALHIYQEGDDEEGGDQERDGQEEGGHQGGDGQEEGEAPKAAAARVGVIWSKDWLKCALVIDGRAHALFDFEAQGGYNLNQWPPPNVTWTRGDRLLTDEMIRKSF
jgi:hypothetical protein